MAMRWNPRRGGDGFFGPEGSAEEGFLDDRESADFSDLTLIFRMPDRSLRRVIERMDMETLSLALRDADQGIVERVLKNVSVRTSVSLMAEMEAGHLAGPDDTAEARAYLVRMILSMEKSGEVSLDGPEGDPAPPIDPDLKRMAGSFAQEETGPERAVRMMIALAARAHGHGLISLEPVLESVPEGILATGIRALVDQIPVEEIETVIGRQIDSCLYAYERNNDIVMEGILSIAEGWGEDRTRQRLVSFLPEGEADFQKLPEIRMTPSVQSANDLILACCRLAEQIRREGFDELEAEIPEAGDPLLRRSLKWLCDGYHIGEVERMLRRRTKTRADRERRKLEILLEGLILIREGSESAHIQESLEGFLEDEA